jgi:hypothetical protein
VPDSGDNDRVVGAHGWRNGRAAHRAGIAATLTAPVLAGASLGLIAITESIVRSALTPARETVL